MTAGVSIDTIGVSIDTPHQNGKGKIDVYIYIDLGFLGSIRFRSSLSLSLCSSSLSCSRSKTWIYERYLF